jgi:hypothetical protein
MVSREDFNADDFVTAPMKREIKVGLLTAQGTPQDISPMQIISAHQKSNENCD